MAPPPHRNQFKCKDVLEADYTQNIYFNRSKHDLWMSVTSQLLYFFVGAYQVHSFFPLDCPRQWANNILGNDIFRIYYSEFHVPLKAEFGGENYAPSDFTMFPVLEKQRWALHCWATFAVSIVSSYHPFIMHYLRVCTQQHILDTWVAIFDCKPRVIWVSLRFQLKILTSLGVPNGIGHHKVGTCKEQLFETSWIRWW